MKKRLSAMKGDASGAVSHLSQPQDVNQQPAEEIVAHYAKKDKAELFDELKRITDETGMDAAKMQALTRQIAPMLSKEQQQRMREVLKKLQF